VRRQVAVLKAAVSSEQSSAAAAAAAAAAAVVARQQELMELTNQKDAEIATLKSRAQKAVSRV
jgi:hypothetical protein